MQALVHIVSYFLVLLRLETPTFPTIFGCDLWSYDNLYDVTQPSISYNLYVTNGLWFNQIFPVTVDSLS